MADVTGAEVSATVNGVNMIVQTDAMRGDFNPNYTPIYRGTGSQNSLVGYYPGLANGKFTIVTDLYSAAYGAGVSAAGLSSGGTLTTPPTISVSLNFGGAGGITVSACKCTYFAISGQLGGLPQLQLEFDVLGPPTEASGGGSAPTVSLPLVFTDMDGGTLIGGASTSITAFLLFARRTLAGKRLNNHSLYMSNARQARVEVGGSVTIYNTGPSERAAFIDATSGCPTLGDVSFSLTQQCVPDASDGSPGTAATVAVGAVGCFYSNWSPGGRDDEYITETLTISSMKNKFSAA